MIARLLKKPYVLVCLLLIIVTAAAFWQVIGNDFINFDDAQYVIDNPNVTAGVNLSSIKWAFTSTYASNWHPLTWLSHMLDCNLYGLNPAGHHLSSLMLHALNALLLFLLVSSATGRVWAAAFVAAVFAVHPLRVESVAWVAERKDVLSGLFWMLTTLAYLRYARNPNIKRYTIVFLLFAMGLMAKPMLVTLPLTLLLLDYWPLRRFAEGDGRSFSIGWKLIYEKTPLLILVVASCAITLWAQQKGGSVVTLEVFSPTVRLANSLVAYVIYIKKMFWPTNLTIFYPHPGATLASWQPIAAAAGLMVISIILLAVRQSRPYLVTGWLWYVITLVPVIGLVQVGGQAVADRYTYIPMIGLSFALTCWVQDILSGLSARLRIRFLCILAVPLVAAMMVKTWSQVGCWSNSVTLFQHAITRTSDNYLAHTNLADALARNGRLDEAIVQSKVALRLAPHNAEAHNNLGGLLSLKQDYKTAVVKFQDALRIDPRYADAHYNMGTTLAALGETREAISYFMKTISIRENHPQAHNNLGNALSALGEQDEAEKHLRRAVELRPDIPENHNNLGINLARQDRLDEAIIRYREAIRIRPEFAGAYVNLGDALAATGELEAATEQFARALSLSPGSAEAHNGLGRVLAVQGEIKDAQEHYLAALRLNADFADAHANLGVALAMEGNINRALIHLNRAVEIMPEHAEAHANLAVAYFHKGRYSEAWEEVSLCRNYGGAPHPAFIEDLSAKMPDPRL